MFADHSRPQAGSSKAPGLVEDDELETDPEYAPKRFHTTKASCCLVMSVQCLSVKASETIGCATAV